MNLLKRILVAVFFIPVLLFIFYNGGYYLLSFLALLSILMNYELILIMKKKDISLSYLNLIFAPLLIFALSFEKYDLVFLILFLQLFFTSLNKIFSKDLKGSIFKMSVSIFILVYTSLFLSFLYLISSMQNGNNLLILLLVLIWITDTGAYFVGMSMGKHRGFIKASPKKSIEGFVGGFIFALLFAYLSTVFFRINLTSAIYASIAAGVFGQIGDLTESLIKRDANIKDSSNIIPGHGGILDRFDSLLLAAPAFYFMLRFL